jgi:adenylate cyclase
VYSKNFFAELQRRNVYKVAIAYGVVSWLLVQIATQVFPFFEIPNWAIRLVIIVLMLGFPVALVFAWVFELTPEGLKRTEEIDPRKSITRSTGRKLDFLIIGVLLLVIAAFAFHTYRSKPPATPVAPAKSVAVLPFIDLSQARDQEYFSDGTTEQITTALAKISGLFVVARTSAFVFKNQSEDIREVGRRLHVQHVLEGSVNRSAGRVRIDAQLINVSDGYHTWSESYDFDEQDALSLQNDIAQKVAAALRVELDLADAKRLAHPPTLDPQANDLYLRGRYLLNRRTIASIQTARELFERAVAKDPRFALAHTAVADSCILLADYGGISPQEAAKFAWREVATALAIDDELAEGHCSRALLLNDFEWNWPAAELEYRRALALDPNNVRARHWYAFHLAELGRFDDAIREIDTAQKQDPLSPLIYVAKGRILVVARRYDEAIEQCRKALDLEPNFAPAFFIIAQPYSHLSQHKAAIDATKKYTELTSPRTPDLALAYAYAVAGQKSESDKIVHEVAARGSYFSAYDMATVCAAWHDNDGALKWLGQAIEQRLIEVSWIRVDPRLDSIRAEPRFQELLARVTPRATSIAQLEKSL